MTSPEIRPGRVQEIEPEQGSASAGGEDLAALERVPDSLAIPALRVGGDEPTGRKEGALAFGLELREERERGGRGIEGYRLRVARRFSGVRREPRDKGGRIGNPGRFRVVHAIDFLEAVSSPGLMVVARSEETHPEALRSITIAKAPNGQHVLRGASGTLIECREPAVCTLAGVQEICPARSRHRQVS